LIANCGYKGRFAPSPTGPLHFGSLLAAMASYAEARARGGEWLLRIEDIDPPRELPGATSDILRTLERCGFAWDGNIVYQSARAQLYASALTCLGEAGLLFACACTRREVAAAPAGAGVERVYPGQCRDRGLRLVEGYAWRVRVPDAEIVFTDALQGLQAQQLAREVGDFVLRRADSLFAYQLAVVVDDADQGITHVVRGSDLLASTARQIWLQRALGLPTPEYLHIPIAVNAAGEKLSKQTLAEPLPRDPLPALLAAWRFLGQRAPAQDIGSVREFWAWAVPAWTRALLPPVPMLPVPRGQARSKNAL
jgi:glutamyl-Q tRNA(Asp) synthetase